MAIYEDPPPGVPEWVVTYGDMMSLILTFFIMIVSMSELKKNDKFQGIADAMEQQFGTTKTAAAGDNQPRRSVLASVIASGRARRALELQGGEALSVVPVATAAHSGSRGILVTLNETSLTLTEDARSLLASEAEVWLTTQPMLEIRGYATALPAESDQFRDAWDLAYERARVVSRYLMEELHLNAERIRVTAVGSPSSRSGMPIGLRSGLYVEVIVQHDQLANANRVQAATASRPSSSKWK